MDAAILLICFFAILGFTIYEKIEMFINKQKRKKNGK